MDNNQGDSAKEKSSRHCECCRKSSESVKNLKKHPNGISNIKCKICDNSFVKNSDFELHVKECHQEAEMYKCDKKFLLNWRLKKHQSIHSKTEKLRFCHYFNNEKECP